MGPNPNPVCARARTCLQLGFLGKRAGPIFSEAGFIASVNRLTEVDALKQPPWLIVINKGIYFITSSSVNRLTEAFFRNRLCK